MPGGVKGPIVLLIFPIEILSNFLRLISLTVRLWANLLAGHLLIAFMGGELGVLVGLQLVSWFLLPAGSRDLPVRGRPDRRPAGLHLCHLDRHLPRRRGRKPLDNDKELSSDAVSTPFECDPPAAGVSRNRSSSRARTPAARSRSASAPVAAPPAPGAGIGAVFNASIQAKTRQPELRAGDRARPVARLRAHRGVFFYGLVGGFIAFFL